MLAAITAILTGLGFGALFIAGSTFITQFVDKVGQAISHFAGGVNYIYSNIPGVLPSIWGCFPYAIKMFCVSLVAIAVVGGVLGKVFNHV